MKKSIKNLLGVMFLITLFCLIMVAVDIFALHDIKNDYLSPEALKDFELNLPADSDWTGTTLEWISVRISWFLKLSLLVVNIIVIFRLERKIQT